MQNFAECIAGKDKFCVRSAAATCSKNYGDSHIVVSAKKYMYDKAIDDLTTFIARG